MTLADDQHFMHSLKNLKTISPRCIQIRYAQSILPGIVPPEASNHSPLKIKCNGILMRYAYSNILSIQPRYKEQNPTINRICFLSHHIVWICNLYSVHSLILYSPVVWAVKSNMAANAESPGRYCIWIFTLKCYGFLFLLVVLNTEIVYTVCFAVH